MSLRKFPMLTLLLSMPKKRPIMIAMVLNLKINAPSTGILMQTLNRIINFSSMMIFLGPSLEECPCTATVEEQMFTRNSTIIKVFIRRQSTSTARLSPPKRLWILCYLHYLFPYLYAWSTLRISPQLLHPTFRRIQIQNQDINIKCWILCESKILRISQKSLIQKTRLNDHWSRVYFPSLKAVWSSQKR